MKESKSSKIMLVYKTLYGFQKLEVHNNFVGVHLYVVYVICRTLVLRISSQIINVFPGVEIVDYLTVGNVETYPNDKFLTC